MASWFRSQFLKVVEYKQQSSDVIVYRYPTDDRQLMKKSKVIVRESQTAIFVHKGQIADIFNAGSHELNSDNIPVLTSLANWKYFFENPITTDIYYINMTQFCDEKWGTTSPIIIRDSDFGMVRIRGFGKYSFKVYNPKKFLGEIFGTREMYTRQEIASYLKTILLSALTDTIAESKIPILDIAGNTLEFNDLIKGAIGHKFEDMGLELVDFFIENISVPEEVEKAMDTRSSMGIMGDKMNQFTQYQASMAMRDAAQNEGGGLAGAGMGLGAGVGLGQVFSNAFGQNMNQTPAQPEQVAQAQTMLCPHCNQPIPLNSKFCSICGKTTEIKQVVCGKCNTKNAEGDKFCSNCGNSLSPTTCECGQVLSPNTKFCPNCGKQQD